MYIFHAIDFSQPLSCSVVPMGGRQRDKKCEYVFKLNTSNAGESEKSLQFMVWTFLSLRVYFIIHIHMCHYTVVCILA